MTRPPIECDTMSTLQPPAFSYAVSSMLSKRSCAKPMAMFAAMDGCKIQRRGMWSSNARWQRLSHGQKRVEASRRAAAASRSSPRAHQRAVGAVRLAEVEREAEESLPVDVAL